MEQTGLPIRRARWMPDAAVKNCPLCGKTFGVFVRKHHCRACGTVVCDSCSRNRISMAAETGYEGPQRICDKCFGKEPNVVFASRDRAPPPVRVSITSKSIADSSPGRDTYTDLTQSLAPSSTPVCLKQDQQWPQRRESDADPDRSLMAVSYTDSRTDNAISIFNVPEPGAISYTVNGEKRPLIRSIKYSQTQYGPRLDFPEFSKGSTLPSYELLSEIRELAVRARVLHDIPSSPVDACLSPPVKQRELVIQAAPPAPPPVEDTEEAPKRQSVRGQTRMLEASEQERRSGIEMDYFTQAGERHSSLNYALAIASLRLRNQVQELNSQRRSQSQPPPQQAQPVNPYANPYLNTPERTVQHEAYVAHPTSVPGPPGAYWLSKQKSSGITAVSSSNSSSQPNDSDASPALPPRRQQMRQPSYTRQSTYTRKEPRGPWGAPWEETAPRSVTPSRGLQRSSTHYTRSKSPAQARSAAPWSGLTPPAAARVRSVSQQRGAMPRWNTAGSRVSAPPAQVAAPAAPKPAKKRSTTGSTARRLRTPSANKVPPVVPTNVRPVPKVSAPSRPVFHDRDIPQQKASPSPSSDKPRVVERGLPPPVTPSPPRQEPPQEEEELLAPPAQAPSRTVSGSAPPKGTESATDKGTVRQKSRSLDVHAAPPAPPPEEEEEQSQAVPTLPSSGAGDRSVSRTDSITEGLNSQVLDDDDRARVFCRTVFDQADSNHDGLLDAAEMSTVFAELAKTSGAPPPSAELERLMMEEIDVDRSGAVDFEEFYRFLRTHLRTILADDERRSMRASKAGSIRSASVAGERGDFRTICLSAFEQADIADAGRVARDGARAVTSSVATSCGVRAPSRSACSAMFSCVTGSKSGTVVFDQLLPLLTGHFQTLMEEATLQQRVGGSLFARSRGDNKDEVQKLCQQAFARADSASRGHLRRSEVPFVLRDLATAASLQPPDDVVTKTFFKQGGDNMPRLDFNIFATSFLEQTHRRGALLSAVNARTGKVDLKLLTDPSEYPTARAALIRIFYDAAGQSQSASPAALSAAMAKLCKDAGVPAPSQATWTCLSPDGAGVTITDFVPFARAHLTYQASMLTGEVPSSPTANTYNRPDLPDILADDDRCWDWCSQAFTAADLNGDGKLDEREMRGVFVNLAAAHGVKVPPKEACAEMFTGIDTNKNGTIELSEFFPFLRGHFLNHFQQQKRRRQH